MVGHVRSWSQSGTQTTFPTVSSNVLHSDSTAMLPGSTTTINSPPSVSVASRPVAVVRAKLREKLEQLFYYHGLNCSRHPLLLVLTALSIFCVCVYPIVGLHLFHNDYSQQFVTDLNDFSALRQLNRQLHLHFEEHHRLPANNEPINETRHNSQNFSFFHEYLINHHSFDLRKELKNPPRWVRFAILNVFYFIFDKMIMILFFG
jgi:hypothetical protein